MAEPEPALLRAYRVVTHLGAPLAGPLLRWRERRGKEDGARRDERFGVATVPRPDGALVWVHAASVGETLAVLPLLRLLLERWQLSVLLTTTTVTSARLAERRLPSGALHQFAPLDAPRFVERFLDHWRPAAALFVESEIWPNIVQEARGRAVPLVLVNARMSERSFERWRRRPDAARSLFSSFELCLAKSELDADRFRELGAAGARCVGNLKFDAPPPAVDAGDLAAFRQALDGRPVWTACSTHPGEEELVLAAHADLAARHPGLLTILAPRHPERRDAVRALAAARGLSTRLRTEGGTPSADTAVFVLDTIGELGLAQILSPIVFMGGSLVPHGGQNPIEPAKLARPVLHGPNVTNFAEVYEALGAAGGADCVAGSADLAGSVDRYLLSPPTAVAHGEAARRAVQPFEGGVARTADAIAPLLEQTMARR